MKAARRYILSALLFLLGTGVGIGTVLYVNQQATNSIASAIYFAWRQTSFLEFTALQQGQVRPLMYSSERLNTRATHIQCCPGQPRDISVCERSALRTELEARLRLTLCAKGRIFFAASSMMHVQVFALILILSQFASVLNASGSPCVISNGVHSAVYSYEPGSDLVSTQVLRNNGAARLTTIKSWEHGYRLQGINNSVSGAPVTSQLNFTREP